MATWKKVIVSGSKADLNEVTASTANITTATIGTATISAGTVTGITDIVVADGGTGASTFTDGGVLLGSATDPITAMAVLGDSEMIVGDGSGDPVAESGATLRTSIGVGTGDSPTFTGLTLSGDLTVQGADIDLTNAATDIDLVDNNASALSFDASGKTGILEIVSTDNAEQVKMSGALEVIGNVSGSASSTGSFGNLYIDDDALIKDRIYFNDFGGEYISGDGTDLNLTSGADINIPADIGLTFGNDGEKIEGNGTKLDIAASEIDFTVEATGDINIGSSIGLTFGDDGEKIEGNGTRMSIASGTGMVLDCEGDIEINADGGNVDIKDDTAVLLNISATKVSGSATSTGSFGELKVTGNVGIEGVTSDTILDIDSNSVSHIVHIAGNGATQFSGSVDVTGSMNATTLQQGGVAIGTAISGSLGLVAGVDTGTTVISGSATSTASFAALTVADGVTATLSPISSDAAALGSTSNQWSDLFLADAGVINWDNGDMTLTNASNEIQVDGGDLVIEGTNKVGFGGAPSTDYIQKSTDLKIVAAADVEINAGGSNVKPSADDGAALGLSGTAFSDLFLASGGVVNWNEGDMTLTHSSNAITVGGGKLVVTGNHVSLQL